MTRQISNADRFLRFMSCHDAYRSCVIDKISCDFYDVLRHSLTESATRSALNCHKAYTGLTGERFRLQLLYKLHKIVMADVSNGTVGAVRNELFLMHPNYSCNMQEYNPPLPHEIIDLLQDLEAFVQDSNGVDTLVKADSPITSLKPFIPSMPAMDALDDCCQPLF